MHQESVNPKQRRGTQMEILEVLITVKTYPIPSSKYDELVCTAGVTASGQFVRLYPINFRDLPYSQQYKKYQWIRVQAEKHKGRDVRKESYRPDSDSIQMIGEPIPTKRGGDWSDRGKLVLQRTSRSMEDLKRQQRIDKTSLGIFKPKEVFDLTISEDDPEWSPGFKHALAQARLWENRTVSREPPRKVPYRFHYHFACDDPECKGNHRMMIEDWEVGALFWKEVDRGRSHEEAARQVKRKFLDEICGPTKDTHFYVGTILAYPTSWVIIGVFWPTRREKRSLQLGLFNQD